MFQQLGIFAQKEVCAVLRQACRRFQGLQQSGPPPNPPTRIYGSPCKKKDIIIEARANMFIMNACIL